MKLCKIYIKALAIVYFLGIGSGFAKSGASREPANFVPDDDMIIEPIIIEKNFIDEFHEKHEREFSRARKKLQGWMRNEQYAKDYGLENTGIVNLPTEAEKEKFLHRHYLRFISKDVERGANKGIQNKLDEWTADDEIDAIETVELHNKVLIKAKKNQGSKSFKKTKSVKVGRSRVKFGFQVRPEIGMMKFDMNSDLFKLRAWIGVNGNQEVKMERKFKSTKTSAFVNYYIDDTRLLAALDQRLTVRWSLRATHAKDFEDFSQANETIVSEDNILQIRFHMGF